MSELNNKLNALSQQQRATKAAALKPAPIKPIAKSTSLRWVGLACAGFVLSGVVGWWLGSGTNTQPKEAQPAAERTVAPNVETLAAANIPKPAPQTLEPEAKIEQSPVQPAPVKLAKVTPVEPVSEPETSQPVAVEADNKPAQTKAPAVVVAKKEEKPVVATPQKTVVKPASSPKPVKTVVAKAPPAKQPQIMTVEPAGSANEEPEDNQAPPEGLVIETVELNAEQLAQVEYKKAQKALDDGDTIKAIRYLESAVQYQPSWVTARKKLSALYYGRGENRRALATLQQGLAYDSGQPEIRLTMAKLFVNESQPQAALNILATLPEEVDTRYLAMRGALAQQLKNNELATSSYQLLVRDEPYDGRWWMGLAIALERSDAVDKAEQAYQQALSMGRISQQSQQFIQQRLAVLASREG
ncbi:tetratricopeptide repeat protein [Photobacterium sanctipauli]|uniref:tetratricopeptide repeat protein n=1 Tax=Photobacterium sanctipauli TaxID=1342794 RepID=UPI001304B1A9|nr:tetratricopeptide repeat protein [Photobacterium sanctipauli]